MRVDGRNLNKYFTIKITKPWIDHIFYNTANKNKQIF